MELALQVTTITPQYKLLKPVKTNPGSDNIRLYNRPLSVDQMEKYILKPASRDLVAIDIETRGLSPFYPHTYSKGTGKSKVSEEYRPDIVGIGLAYPSRGGYKAAYFDPRVQTVETMKHFYTRLGELHLVAHNAMFDGLWLRFMGKELGVDVRPNWVADTYGLFKQFAGEDFIGQGHGLKNAQVDLLGWDEKGDVELDEWLIDHGYYTESGKKNERVKKAAKGEMWRTPFEVLSKYCALDCISTLQLFDYIFEPLMKRFPMYWDYHGGPFIRTIHELVDQQIHGVRVDTEKLMQLEEQLDANIHAINREFFALEEIRPYLEEWRQMQIDKIKVPPQFKKNGEVSKNYLNYEAKVRIIKDDKTYGFNPGSGKQLQWLFYERMYKNEAVTITYNRRDIKCFKLQSPRGEILLPATDAGQPPTDKNALPWLGKAGEILLKRAKEVTSLTTFVEPYLEFSTTSYDGRMHPGWKVPQAVTGRLGGSKPNFQQITGDKRVLECILAEPDYVIVESDFRALEDYVAANVTRCPGLLSLYGPNAKENDGHLFLGSQLPVIGEKIRKYYDPDNPTPESIKAAKKHCKLERDVAKKVKYSATYGIGAFKLWQDLMCEGINIELDTVAQVLRGYWEVNKGMQQHKWKLKDEWERKRGWIYNAVKRPMSVGDHHLKDLFSRCVQGGGHDLNMMFGMHIADRVAATKIRAMPFIYNLHDAVYYQVHKDDLDTYLSLKQEAEDKVWDFCKNELGWDCVLKTSHAYGSNLKELKS